MRSAPVRHPLRSRGAALVALVAQLVIGVLAPVIESRTWRGVGVHAEQAGTRLHASHDEASCPSCAARPLVEPAGLGARAPRAPHAVLPTAARVSAPAGTPRHTPGAPRAPPLPV